MATAKEYKKRLALSITFAFFCILITILTVNIFIPSYHYNKALALIEKGDYEGAYCNLRNCKAYKNSKLLLENFEVVCDKTIEYHYDENNNLIKYIEEVFDKNDNLISRKEYVDGQLTYEAEYKFNEYGDQISYTIISDGELVQSGTYKYTYDKNGNKLTEEEYWFDELEYKGKYTYDDKGNVVKEEFEGHYYSIPNRQKITVTHTKDGSLREIIKYGTGGSVKQTIKETIDKNGVLRLSVCYSSDGNKTSEIIYDKYGYETDSIHYDANGNKTANHKHTYDYDQSGAKIKQYVAYQGETETYRAEYKYDSRRNNVLITCYENGKLCSENRMTYDKNGNQLKSVRYEYFNGQKIKATEYIYQYDRFGNKIARLDRSKISNDYLYTYDDKGVFMTTCTLYYNSVENNTRSVTEYVNPRFVYNENFQ